uniref:Leishmanolysin-like peptidase n=1 Tax=Pseudictyota dubia TaxID=2749911 RepID=A0A7R9WA24_9STRA
MFEDTGWYVADYSVSSISPFGHGLGCSFVAGPCVVDGQVPPASRGVFCGPSEPEIGCSPDHRMVAACDLVVYNQDLPKKFRYFDDAKVGGGLAQLDYCPAYLRESFLFPSGLRSHLDCTDSSLQGATFASPSETFGPTSRCIETGYSRPYCFRTNCDAERHLVEITVRTSNGEFNVECPEAGRTVTVPWILDLEIRCPSLARICPDLVCPAHCSGRGVCDWTLDDPECRCNDDADDSPICANSPTVTIMSPTVSPRPTRTPVVSETDPPASAPVSQEARSSGFRHCRQRRELVSWTRWEEAAMGLVIWSAPLWALLF